MNVEQVAEAIILLKNEMAKAAKEANGNIESAYDLPDGGTFIIKYELPKKK